MPSFRDFLYKTIHRSDSLGQQYGAGSSRDRDKDRNRNRDRDRDNRTNSTKSGLYTSTSSSGASFNPTSSSNGTVGSSTSDYSWGLPPTAPPPSAPAIQPPRALIWTETWSDPHNLRERWILEDAGGGFGNQELQWYDPEQVRIGVDGLLNITATSDGKQNFRSGKMFCRRPLGRESGYVEVAVWDLPVAKGIWPAIWLLPTEGTSVLHDGLIWPSGGELDLLECGITGNEGKILQCAHWGTYEPQDSSKHSVKASPLPSQPSGPPKQLQVGLAFSSHSLTFYLNRIPTHSITVPSPPFSPMSKFTIILNVAMGGTATSFSKPKKGEYVMKVGTVGLWADPPGGWEEFRAEHERVRESMVKWIPLKNERKEQGGVGGNVQNKGTRGGPMQREGMGEEDRESRNDGSAGPGTRKEVNLDRKGEREREWDQNRKPWKEPNEQPRKIGSEESLKPQIQVPSSDPRRAGKVESGIQAKSVPPPSTPTLVQTPEAEMSSEPCDTTAQMIRPRQLSTPSLSETRAEIPNKTLLSPSAASSSTLIGINDDDPVAPGHVQDSVPRAVVGGGTQGEVVNPRCSTLTASSSSTSAGDNQSDATIELPTSDDQDLFRRPQRESSIIQPVVGRPRLSGFFA